MGAKNGDDNVEGLHVYKFMFRSTRGTLHYAHMNYSLGLTSLKGGYLRESTGWGVLWGLLLGILGV